MLILYLFVKVALKEYSELTPTQKEQILSLIESEGEVPLDTLRTRFSAVKVVAVIEDKGFVIATGSIKTPEAGYRDSVFLKSKSELESKKYTNEIGYIVVDEKYRGKKLSQKVCEALCLSISDEFVFATTRTDNYAMQKVLKNLSFSESGVSYAGRRENTELKLLVKYENKKFHLAEKLRANAGIHCACLAIAENAPILVNGIIEKGKDAERLRNGTITFVKSEGRTYAITCWHVVELLRKMNAEKGSRYYYTFQTMVNGFYNVIDRFIRPKDDIHVLDVAIREIVPEFLTKIGKEAIDIDILQLTNDIKFGYAVGFPEALKRRNIEDGTMKTNVSMPQVEILAEIDDKPLQRFTLFSELQTSPPYDDYSGMSGGPIFWSEGQNYGIYGIAYEAGSGSQLTDKGIFVYGELATPEKIKNWISQIPREGKVDF